MSDMFLTKTLPSTTTRLNVNNLIEGCNRLQILLQKSADSQLQSAYAMQGFKATDKKTNSHCYVFVALFSENVLLCSSYFNAFLILKREVTPQNFPQFVKQSLANVMKNQNSKSSDQMYKQAQKLFQNLNKHSQKVLKNAQNQIIAVQQIKSSQQYMSVCNYAKMASLQLKQLCQVVEARQNKARIKNQKMIDKMLSLEISKEKLNQTSYKYNEAAKQTVDVEVFLEKFIQQKKQKLVNLDFNDEQSFNKYLQENIDLKKLENTKKFLSYN